MAWVTEKSRMMVTIQLRRIINAYLGRFTKPVLNRILRLSNFWLQNSSNFNAVIQIFLCLHEPNSPFVHSYVSFASQSANKYLHLKTMMFVYKAFSRSHLVTNLWSFLPRNDIPQKGFYGPKVFRLTEIKDMWQWRAQVFFFRKVCFFRRLTPIKNCHVAPIVHFPVEERSPRISDSGPFTAE